MHSLLAGSLVLFAAQSSLRAEVTNQAPDFKEVYDTIRAHLSGMSDTDLNRAAVQGLLSALSSKVMLVSDSPADTASDSPLVSKSTAFDDAIGYVRIARMGDGLDKEVREAWQQLSSTNRLKGLVIDLRYTGGDDYAAATKVADLFLKKQRPLLNWGNGMVESKEKDHAFDWPVAVLVNGQTASAAEALAGVLRETGAGLVLGSQTAGRAMIAQEFPLKSGGRLRIATGPVQLGDGSALSARGLKPDIAVDVSAADEHAYYADAFRLVVQSNPSTRSGAPFTSQPNGTNALARRNRYNEAELVRERREGVSLDPDGSRSRRFEPEKPVVHDPALARALDLLKGLAVVRQARS